MDRPLVPPTSPLRRRLIHHHQQGSPCWIYLLHLRLAGQDILSQHLHTSGEGDSSETMLLLQELQSNLSNTLHS